MTKPMITPRIYQLKISLNDISPEIWRRFLVESDISLGDLHCIIQDVMGWENDHLYEFVVRRTKYVDPFCVDRYNNEGDVNLMTLEEAFTRVGCKCEYTYDFGDCWKHKIVLEKTFNPVPGEKYPRCIEGSRRCPPEDCGGFYRYEYFLEVLTDPEDKEYKYATEWFGDDYDPELFDLEKVNRRLQ